ncbi:hypothetical protein K1719_030858 [Acacia pycnantha]|nr:hypothetical protein K1719_030858 [Acacia pycnantha]
MDNPGENTNLALFTWRERRRRTIVHVICLIVYYYMIRIHSQSSIVDHTMILEKERAREKIMKRIASSEGRKIIRMGPIAFMNLCAMLEREGGLQSTQRVGSDALVSYYCKWHRTNLWNQDTKQIIIACCILHNYLMMTDHEEELVAEVDEEIANQSVSEQHGDDHIEEDENEEHTRLGENLRNSTADAMWRAYRS